MNTPPLDSKNLEILTYLSQGLTYKEIGQKVFLSYEAVKKRLEGMKERSECRNDKALIFHYSEIIKGNELKQTA